MKKLTHTKGLSSNRLRAVSKLLRGAIKSSLLLGLMGISLQIASAASFVVSNGGDGGGGSLRQAILDANATANTGTTPDLITFSSALSIVPTSPLPPITEAVTIDGYSASGASRSTAALGVGFNGTLVVELNGSMAGDSVIGLQISAGNCTIQGLAINRFQGAGIRIDAGTASKIFGNFIGTDLSGTTALGNFDRGVLIVGSTLNQIGTAASSTNSNVISGNFGTGISITGGGSALVRRNFIGTDKNGTADLGNTQDGVRIVDSSGSTIGGADSGSRNIISGNDANGVAVVQSATTTVANTNLIQANFIGVDVTGNATTAIGGFQTSPVGNSGSGVLINAAGNTVGGNRTTSATSSSCNARCNVISGNRANGVSVSSGFASANIVSGNNIGVGLDNTTAIGNRDNGVQVSNLAAGNTIGGTNTTSGFCNNACNMIANNGSAEANSARAGVYVDITGGAGNRIRGNSIFMNTGIGIDLSNVGATANDSQDPDLGANNRQNAPVLNSASSSGVAGGLNSTPNTTFDIEFFRNVAPDTTSTSEARTFVSFVSVTTDGSGNATFNSGQMNFVAGQIITATATTTGGTGAQAIGDTSEISNAQTVSATGGEAGGLESDVAGRPTGDNLIQSNDVIQVQRFLNEQDAPSTVPNEFQRADSAPRPSSGNGVIDAADVQQALRYLNEIDALQPAGGPVASASPSPTPPPTAVSSEPRRLSSKSTNRILAPVVAPELRVESTRGSAGNPVTVNIRVDAVGNETQYAFAVTFDPNVLTFANFAAGDTGAGTFSCNTTATAGRVRCNVGNFPMNRVGSPAFGEIAPGDNQLLIRVIFNVAPTAPSNSTTTVSIADASVADENASSITPRMTPGTVTINSPTAAGASINGRVTTGRRGVARAVVTLTDENGVTRRTTTNAFGTYRFTGIPAGQTYNLNVQAKRYRFAPQIVNLNQDANGLNFTAAP